MPLHAVLPALPATTAHGHAHDGAEIVGRTELESMDTGLESCTTDAVVDLLAFGYPVEYIAKRLGITVQDVKVHRSCRYAKVKLAQIRLKRELDHEEQFANARAALAEQLVNAVEALGDVLSTGQPRDKLRAAELIIERCGLRAAPVRAADDSVDTTLLNDEELRAYLQLLRKASTK